MFIFDFEDLFLNALLIHEIYFLSLVLIKTFYIIERDENEI